MKSSYPVLFGLFIMVLFFQNSAYSVHTTQPGVSEHEDWIKIYEQRAAKEDDLIQEHVEIKKAYKSEISVYKNDKKKIAEVEKHCDAIIKDAEALRNHFLDFAKWHKRQSDRIEKKSQNIKG